MVRQASPIDARIGRNLRVRRILAGLSQEKLGERMGVSFQQIQKYEAGTNRLSGSRIVQAAAAVNVPPAYLLELDAAQMPNYLQRVSGPEMDNKVMEFLASTKGGRLVRYAMQIEYARDFDALLALARAMVASDEVDKAA